MDYVNVISQPGKLAVMLEFSGGVRSVPVIVDGAEVTIGFGGGS